MFLQRLLIRFKRYAIFAVIFLTLFQNATAQKVKDYVLNVDYQAVPPYNLHVERVQYLYKINEECIDLNNQIKTLETWSTGNSDRTGFYNANLPSLGFFTYWKEQVDGTYQVDINIGLPMMQSKNFKSVTRQNTTNPSAPAINAIAYELTYTMPFTVVMKNAGDSVIFDEKSMFEKPTVLIFPDDFASVIPNYQGYVSQQAVEALFVQNEIKVAKIVKDKIIASHFNQFSKILNKRHDEVKGNMGFEFYYLKDRKVEYPAFDSALTIMKVVCDSIKQNQKAKNYRNWHTTYVQQQLKIVQGIIYRLSIEYIDKHKNKLIEDDIGREIIFALNKNRYAVMLLQNRYDEALLEIEDYIAKEKYDKYFSYMYLDRMRDNFKEEKRRYENNKKYYKWE